MKINEILELLNDFFVIPVISKKACIAWKQYQDNKPTEENVKEWWTEWPDADVAAVLQPGYVVLDIDSPELAENLISRGICEMTRVEKSLKGLHIWFKETGSDTKTENLRHSYGIEAELRTYGTYLVIPPSKGYELISNKPIMEVWDAKLKALELLGINKPCESLNPKNENVSADKLIPKGDRNNRLTSLAGALYKKISHFAAGVEALKAVNKAVCNPPLPEAEVEAIARSIFKAESGSSSEVSSTPKEKKWLSLKDLAAKKLPTISWIWDNFLAKGYVTLLSGRPKAGKTTLLFELIKTFLNKKSFIGQKTNLDGKILILTEENEQLYRKRAADAGILTDDVLVMSRFTVNGWKRDEILDHVEWCIEQENVSLVVIDTLSDFWGVSEENDAPEVQDAMRSLRAIAYENNVALLLIHHLRKMDGDEGTAIRGSGALLGSVDIGLEFHYANSKNPRRRKLRSNSRFADTPKEVIIELTKDGYSLLGDAAQVTREDIQTRFLDALHDSAYEAIEDIAAKMEPKPGISILKEIASECRKKALVDFTGEGKKGKPYQYRKPQVEALV